LVDFSNFISKPSIRSLAEADDHEVVRELQVQNLLINTNYKQANHSFIHLYICFVNFLCQNEKIEFNVAKTKNKLDKHLEKWKKIIKAF
jgi:hypothetical protein